MSQISPTHPRRLADVATFDMETDVAVVGFGGAGGCAAIEASDQGAAVTIFEVASASGGSTALSSAEIYMGGGGGTRVQQACGYDDSTEALYAYLKLCMGDVGDDEKIRCYAEGSPEHFDWIVGLGVPYKDTEYKMKLDTRGYKYTLTEPIPVTVTEGRVRGTRQKPYTEFMPKPGVDYSTAEEEASEEPASPEAAASDPGA